MLVSFTHVSLCYIMFMDIILLDKVGGQVSFIYLPDSTSILESTLTATTIYTVEPTGGDEPYTCSVALQDPDDATRFFDFTGQNLQTLLTFDYETTTRYVLTIECEDGSSVTGTSSLTVNIVDINDETPVIMGTLTANLSEKEDPGTVITDLFNATDDDANDNLMYSFTGSDSAYFQIDSTSGTVSVKTRLDRDSVGARVVFDQLTLVVQDSMGFSATASLTITLDDINDNTPVFSPVIYYVNIPENRPPDQLLVTLTCSDGDESPGNGDITYSILSGDDSPGKFTLSGLNLQTTNTSLDYDVLSSQNYQYQLIITATDGGGTPNTGTATVFVQVENENDCHPIWGTFIPAYVNSTTSYNIREDVSVGTTVLTMLASDCDLGEDGQITYHLDSTTDDVSSLVEGIFRVNVVTGVLVTDDHLDCDTGGSEYYDVVIQAIDKGSPAKSISRTVHIGLQEVNDNPPVFDQSLYEITVLENSLANTSILVLSATDEDSTSTLSYSIISGNTLSKFHIVNTNALQTQSLLDLEEPNNDLAVYTLVVTVVDGGTVELTGSTTVVVSVTPVNDHTPVFSPASHNITKTISENTDSGTSLVSVTATDADYGNDGLVSYSISSGDANYNFYINPNTGIVKTALDIDYDTLLTNPIELVLQATDRGGNVDSATLTISVLDENDQLPVCSKLVISTSISENITVGSQVLTLSCSGVDISDTVTYEIISGNIASTFNITSAGVITLINAVDYESGITTYSLVIEASDGLGTESVQLAVNIEPVNEDIPVFIEDQVNVTWSEDTGVGTTLTILTATDLDDGIHGEITYEISVGTPSVSGLIGISSLHGDLILLQPLDYETSQSYSILITATDGGGLQATSTVNLLVTDVNDNSPVCNPSYSVVNTPEENLGGETYPVTIWTSLACTDQDEGDILTYTLSPNPYAHLFTVDSTTGAINITGPLDYETLTSYSLVISVEDDGIPVSMSTSADILISVSDVNDGPPVFGIPTSLSVSEGAMIGQHIADVTATDPDSSDTDDGRLLYSLTDGDINSQFAVERTTGKLTVNRELDSETVSSYLLLIEAMEESGTYTANTTLNITLLDVNDNPPDCPTTDYNVFYGEDASVGDSILSFTCTDSDQSEEFSSLTYSISGGDTTKFTMIGSNLTVQNLLDYDLGMKMYDLVITVSDDLFIEQLQVTVNIEPVNEHTPLFLDDSFTVSEDTTLGTTVHQVTATDADQGDDGTILYTMQPHPKFLVDEFSGEITLIDYIDVEIEANYTLLITAVDLGIPPLNDTAIVSVTVLDANDNTPVFSPGYYSVTTPEDTPIGTTLLSLTCIDQDTGINSDVSYSIESGDPEGTFRLEKYIPTSEGMLILHNITFFDYEYVTFMDLVVHCTDGLGKFSDAHVSIYLTSINEFEPVFEPVSSSEKLIPENSTVGSIIYSVSASDLDHGLDGNLSYVMPFSSLFTVDHISGSVTVSGRLEHIDSQVYYLDILAVDGGLIPGPKTATYSLTVNITHVNAEAPVCNSIYVEVSELATPSQFITDVTCHDVDLPNNQMTFTLLNTSVPFTIHSASGKVYTDNSSTFDRETISNYSFLIQVSEVGSPELFTVVSLYVDIKDENDNVPEFCGSPYSLTILEDIPIGSYLMQLTATDADATSFGTVMYEIEPGSHDNIFVIHPITGQLQTTASLKTGTETLYNISVVARDMGSLPLESMAIVLVQTRVNFLPTCQSLFYYSSILENMSVSQIILTVSCNDVDDDVFYSLLPGSIPFSVNTTSGELSLSSVLDAETVSSYILAVVVMAGDVRINVTVTLDIIDVNEFSPVFDPGGTYSITISELIPIGSLVTVLNVTDNDVSFKPYFYLTSGDTDNIFLINQLSGAVRVNSTLDFESIAVYYLEFVVFDSLWEALSASVTLTVSLSDENDNPPICIPDVYYFNISETDTGFVMNIACTDVDNSDIIYTILSGNTNTDWSVNNATGDIDITSLLNYENCTDYDLKVEVSDGLFSTDVYVFIHVEDYNEFNPVFSQTVYLVDIDEDELLGTDVVMISATDNDGDDTEHLIFSIIDNSSQFVIDPSSGSVMLSETLDRETTGFYSLGVNVCDRPTGNPEQLCGDAVVTITVTDVNDNNPIFTSDHYVVSVIETEPIGNTVITVSASDADQGPNAQLSFLIISGNNAGLFSVSNDTIYIDSPLDYETQVTHCLLIEAIDAGMTVLSSSTILTVNILPVNEFTPVFSGNVSISIAEDTPVSTVIYTVSASDEDTGLDGHVIYSIVSPSTPEQSFFMEPGSGKVQIWSPLDFDTGLSTYQLTIMASDREGNSTGLSSSMTLTVELTDVNDVVPTFNHYAYFFTVLEHVPAGTFIGQVTANDSDSGVNGDIEYSLLSSDDSIVVNSSTGILTTGENVIFDSEIKQQYTFVVSVHDFGSPRLSSEGLVYITVSDTNDRTPLFEPTNYTVYVFENTSISTSITQVTASDPDTAGGGGHFTYSISPMTHFSIDSVNGIITLSSPLDYESQTLHVLSVQAVDQGTVQLTGSGIVTVVVDDINDNPPVITGVYDTSIAEDVHLLTSVLTVTAIDGDSGINADLVYNISSGNTNDDFLIDELSGLLVVWKELDRERQSVYNPVVTVVDQGENPQSTSVTITLTILDVNDVPPTFLSVLYQFDVTEDVPLGTVIGQLSAYDNDTGANAVLHFHIHQFSTGPAHFEIDHSTGNISTTHMLDRETLSTYGLVCQVFDSGTPQLSDDVFVSINITDANDHHPIFSQDLYVWILVDGKASGEHSLSVDVTDDDIEANADITLSFDLSTSNGTQADSMFSVDSSTYIIQNIVTIDITTHESFSFLLYATDNGVPVLTGTSTVSIEVVDANDNDPVFTDTYLSEEVPYDSRWSSLVTTVNATDSDLGLAGLITYYIVPSSNFFYFSIDPDTGEVNLQSNTELDTTFILYIGVHDNGEPQRESTTYLPLRVDTFNPSLVTVSIKLGVSKDDISDHIEDLMVELSEIYQVKYPSATAKLWYLEERDEYVETISSKRRRRTVPPGTRAVTAHVYVLSKNTTDNINNYYTPKVFLPANEVLDSLLGIDLEVSPELAATAWANYTIKRVELFEEVEKGVNNWSMIVIFSVLGTVLFIVLIVAAFRIYQKRNNLIRNRIFRRRTKKSPKSKKHRTRKGQGAIPLLSLSKKNKRRRPVSYKELREGPISSRENDEIRTRVDPVSGHLFEYDKDSQTVRWLSTAEGKPLTIQQVKRAQKRTELKNNQFGFDQF